MPSLPSTPSVFQSTLSMRRATVHFPDPHGIVGISIHALHEESDSADQRYRYHRLYFNPRSP